MSVLSSCCCSCFSCLVQLDNNAYIVTYAFRRNSVTDQDALLKNQLLFHLLLVNSNGFNLVPIIFARFNKATKYITCISAKHSNTVW